MKNNKYKKRLDNLKEVQDWVFGMIAKNEFYIYRGQGDSDWRLNSVFSRKNENIFNNEKQHFSYIKEYFIEKSKFLRQEFKNLDDLSLLGEMQHHGQPIPLIDFTEDIFIALWFGVSYFSNNVEQDPKYFRIFYIKEKEWQHNDKLNFEKIEMNGITTLKFNTGQKIKRSISQKSIFIFDNLNLDKKINYIDINNEFDLKKQIISWLEKMGITSNSIFPDIEGVFESFDFQPSQKFFMRGLKMMNLNKLGKVL